MRNVWIHILTNKFKLFALQKINPGIHSVSLNFSRHVSISLRSRSDVPWGYYSVMYESPRCKGTEHSLLQCDRFRPVSGICYSLPYLQCFSGLKRWFFLEFCCVCQHMSNFNILFLTYGIIFLLFWCMDPTYIGIKYFDLVQINIYKKRTSSPEHQLEYMIKNS